MFSNPRTKLLARLGQSGLLNGEENRKRQVRDLKDYPDIAALAHVAKTKEQFYEIMGSPQAQERPEPEKLQECAIAQAGYAVTVSPASTSAGPDSSADELPSPEMLPRSHADLMSFDLIEDAVPEASHTPPLREPSPAGSGRNSPPGGNSPVVDAFQRQMSPSATPPGGAGHALLLPELSRDPDRADLLWKLAGHGSPQLKPLENLEMETV